MIIELLCTPIFLLINGVIAVIPAMFQMPNWLADLLSMLLKAMQFFPIDVWVICIGNISFWLSLHFIWAILEWLYKKIPRCKLGVKTNEKEYS